MNNSFINEKQRHEQKCPPPCKKVSLKFQKKGAKTHLWKVRKTKTLQAYRFRLFRNFAQALETWEIPTDSPLPFTFAASLSSLFLSSSFYRLWPLFPPSFTLYSPSAMSSPPGKDVYTSKVSIKGHFGTISKH